MTTQRQQEVAHARAKVGCCPFCQKSAAELWFDPEEDVFPFQVRCSACGARGPFADCGWESAVPSWDMIQRRTDVTLIGWRGPGSDISDPHQPKSD